MTTFNSSAYLEQIAVLKGKGAPWHQLVEAYYAGEDEVDRTSRIRSGRHDHDALTEYRRKAEVAAGIPAPTLHRMGLALAKLQIIAGTKATATDLLSDDFEAVEAAIRIAERFSEEGLQALRDLKAGRLTREAVVAMPGGWSSEDAASWQEHVQKLAELNQQGAPWWRLVQPFLSGNNAAEEESFVRFRAPGQTPAAEYRQQVYDVTGIDADTLFRMARTLVKIELLHLPAGCPLEEVLPDKFEGVEIGVRISESDLEDGRLVLRELKEGKSDLVELRARLAAIESAAAPPPAR